MDKEKFINELSKKAEQINFKLNEEQCEKFYNYMNLLLEWNEKINLTAIVEPEEIITKHFIDSIIIAKHIKENEKVADIGTGAGFPGIPLKIASSSLDIILVDALNKRIKFLKEVLEKLNLQKIDAIHARVEEFARSKENRESFDIVTSRAVAKLNVLAEYMLPLTKVGGKCICMKGPEIEEELKESKQAIEILGGKISKIEQFNLPGTDMKRSIVIIEKIKETPSKYPRKPGIPTKEPIK